MRAGGEDERKKCFKDRKLNLLEATMKFIYFVVVVRHDSAEIWVFRYGLTHGIGTLKFFGQHRRFACGLRSESLY
jgi:hypothetical protein